MAKFMVAFDVSKVYLGECAFLYNEFDENEVKAIRDALNEILSRNLNGFKVCETTFIVSVDNISSAHALIDEILNNYGCISDDGPVFSDEEKEHIRITVVEFGSTLGGRGSDRGIESRHPIDDKNLVYGLAGRL